MCLPGSIPEADGGKLFNTCSVFGPDGKLLVKHRKVSVCCRSYSVTLFCYFLVILLRECVGASVNMNMSLQRFDSGEHQSVPHEAE